MRGVGALWSCLRRALERRCSPSSTHAQLWEETGRRPRLLFLAHRRELLVQAAGTFRRMLRDRGDVDARVGWFAEDRSELSADLVFASVAKLSRRENLERLRREKFDYVVVDEVHHAAARSYRDILDASSTPTFLLGLTATPDRADAADVAGLFDDHIAYRAGIEKGIELERLVPFRYHGVRDDIDYENIPWRNRRFDPERARTRRRRPKRACTRCGARGSRIRAHARSSSAAAWPTRSSSAPGFARTT